MRSGSRCPAFYGEIPPTRWGILDDDGGYFYCITYKVKQPGLIRKNISTTYLAGCLTRNGRNETLRWRNIFPGLLKSRKNVNDKSHRIWIVSHIWWDFNMRRLFTAYVILGTALGWSMARPSNSQRYCRGSISRKASSVLGHWYRPLSKRLYRRTKPSPLQRRALNRSLLLPQKRKSAESKTLSWNCCATIPDSPSIDLRISV